MSLGCRDVCNLSVAPTGVFVILYLPIVGTICADAGTGRRLREEGLIHVLKTDARASVDKVLNPDLLGSELDNQGGMGGVCPLCGYQGQRKKEAKWSVAQAINTRQNDLWPEC